MSKLPNYLLIGFLFFFTISFLFFVGTRFSFAQYPTPTPTSPPAGYCGDGECQDWLGEGEYTCPEDCGAPAPPGWEQCWDGTCPDGKPYWTYCTPDCTTVPRLCYDDPACPDDPPHCADPATCDLDGYEPAPGGGCCPTEAHCGPGADCGVVLCNLSGGNCFSDCSDCVIITPTPTPTGTIIPTPTPTPLVPSAPSLISVSPSGDCSSGGDTITFTATYQDPDGAGDIARTWFAIAPGGATGESGCTGFEESLMGYVGVFYFPGGAYYTAAEKDDGTCPWDWDESENNGNADGSAYVTSVNSSTNGDYLDVVFIVRLESNFPTGTFNIYMMVGDQSGLSNGPGGIYQWLNMGSWTFPCPPTLPVCTEAILSPDAFSLTLEKEKPLPGVNNLEGGASLGDIDHVGFVSLDPGVVSIVPPWETVGSWPYQTRVRGESVGGPATIKAYVYLKPDDGVPDCTCDEAQGNCTLVTVTAPSAWFQTEEGDVHADGSIDSEIPDAAADLNFSIGSSLTGGGTWGVVSYDTGTADFGDDGFCSNDSTTHWLADSSVSNPYNYDYFYSLLGSPAENWDGGVGNFPADPGTGETEIIYTTSPAHLPAFSDLSGRKLIVLTSSNAIIENEITVGDGFLAVIALNHINIADSVAELHGVYIADGRISTGEGAVEFTGEGMFISNESPSLGRDLEEDNNGTPAEKFIYRPDLLINSPQEFWKSRFTWQELAP